MSGSPYIISEQVNRVLYLVLRHISIAPTAAVTLLRHVSVLSGIVGEKFTRCQPREDGFTPD